jgi:putative copper export protein
MEWVFARWLSYAATVLLVGVCGIRALTRRVALPSELGAIDADLARLAVGASLAILPASALRLVDQALAVQLPGASVLSGVQLLLTSTSWGAGFCWQMLALTFALAASRWLRRTPSRWWAWLLLAIGAAGLCATPALQGHAIGDETQPALAVASDVLHVLGAGAWIGGIAVLGWLGMQGAPTGADDSPTRTHVVESRLRVLVPLVPPLALTGAGVLILTGVTSSAIHLQSLADLWSTEWGRFVLVKVGLLLVTAALGALNWRRLGRRLSTTHGVQHLRRALLIELGAAMLTLVVTAVLVVTPLPGE